MTDPEKPKPELASLEHHLAQLKSTQHTTAPGEDHNASGAANAYRAAGDFAAAAFVGCGLGYGIDLWLESTPWGLLAGLLIGVVAGFRMMMRDVQSPENK